MTSSLSLLTPSGRLTLGNLLGALRPMPQRQDDRALLRPLRPARDDHAPRPRRAAGAHPRDGDAAARGRARPEHAVPAERGARPHRAGLPARVHGVHRRAEPDDPVQGEGPRRADHPGLALHLPGADGRRHPALPARRRCRSATTSASTSSSPATSRSASTAPTARCSPCPRSSRPRPARGSWTCAEPTRKMSKSVDAAPGRSCCSTRPTSYAARSARAVTDSDTGPDAVRADREAKPGVTNLLDILAACGGSADGITTYGALKAAVTEAVVGRARAAAEAYAELADDPALRRARSSPPGPSACREVTEPVLAPRRGDRPTAGCGLRSPRPARGSGRGRPPSRPGTRRGPGGSPARAARRRWCRRAR